MGGDLRQTQSEAENDKQSLPEAHVQPINWQGLLDRKPGRQDLQDFTGGDGKGFGQNRSGAEKDCQGQPVG